MSSDLKISSGNLTAASITPPTPSDPSTSSMPLLGKIVRVVPSNLIADGPFIPMSVVIHIFSWLHAGELRYMCDVNKYCRKVYYNPQVIKQFVSDLGITYHSKFSGNGIVIRDPEVGTEIGRACSAKKWRPYKMVKIHDAQ